MKRLILCLTALLLAAILGCGWHLRGTGSYRGPTAIHLVPEDRFAPLTLAVIEAMRRRSVSNTEDALLHLYLGQEELQKRVVAVTSIGSPAQYEMSLSAQFRYQVPAEPLIIPSQTLSVERVFDFDPSSTVAKHEEENTLLEEMRRELAQRILQQARHQQMQQKPSYGQAEP